ncbi:MAG: PAS domain S-box protein [Lentisphaerae bacterium]|jgi:PAS domain S-box-containing protein|nr:PAS domain S-box protein [Lentisphaerota bacterium]MBT4818600.1 PAS domain S-box protein [Lentisphaerota bacterium]MBT5604507.1 PAS domain S-box protein [Lentisphaerota bacterium]MBT7060508.1 PAS domain S-box protein [Lentisphaerota bacterium]MBT7844415.1 PAS domain S-box protein [Lentisphaerota bacterium]
MAGVLVVDDERSMRVTLREFLLDAGYDATAVEDVDSALAVFDDGSIDVIVSDIAMPVRTGVDLVQAIRERGSRVPVILITGQPSLETAGDAVRARAFDYLQKPVSEEMLLRVVASAAEARVRDHEHEQLQEENRRYQEQLSRLVDQRTQQLWESEERNRILLDAVPDLLFQFDRSGVFKACRAPTDAAFAMPKDEFLGRKVTEVMPPDFARDVMRCIHSALDSDGLQLLEYQLPNPFPGGELSDFEARFSACSENEVLAIVRDVTDRHRAEERLAFLGAVSEQVSDSIICTDLENRITYVNAAACSLFRYSVDELMGRTPDILNAEPLAEDIQRELYRTVAAGRTYMETCLNKRKDGTTFVCEFKVAPMRNSDGQPCGYIGVQRDMTPRVRAEEKLQRSEAKLRELAVDLTRVEERERRSLAVYLHDDISQALALARMKFALVAEDVEHGKQVTEEIEEIRALLDQTIEGAQTLTFDLSPPVLHQLGLSAAIEWAGEKLGDEHGLAFVFKDDGRERVLGQDARAFVFRATRELMFNVVKHAQASRLAATVAGDRSEICVTIEDNGIGFPSTDREDAWPEREFGIFSIRQRLEFLGGTLDIVPASEGGTRAVLSVPLATCEDKR